MSKELLKQLREEPGLPTTGSKGSSTSKCYQVQARMCSGWGPKVLTTVKSGWGLDSDILTDSEWKTIHFPESTIGVPMARQWDEFAQHGYLSYSAAQALRWWFLAEHYKLLGLGGIETRLVEYTFEYSYSATPVRAVNLVDPEQREDILPDWGKPAAEKVK